MTKKEKNFCPTAVEDLPPWRPQPRAGLLSAMIIQRCSDHELSFSGRSPKQMQGAEQKVLPVIFCKEDQSVLHGTVHMGAKKYRERGCRKEAMVRADVKLKERKQKPQTVVKKLEDE